MQRGQAEVFASVEGAVGPANGVDEVVHPLRHRLIRRQPANQLAFEQVLLAAVARSAGVGCTPGGRLEGE